MTVTDTDRNVAADVVAALAAVKAEMGGIPKLSPEQRGRSGEHGVNYAYRSIDQIAAAAQPLFGKHQVVLAPEVVSYDKDEVLINNRPWSHITMLVRYWVYGPNGSMLPHPVTVVGEGRDNSDKGMNKAQTAAYKNALLRLLDIGDPQDDPDHERHEADEKTGPAWWEVGGWKSADEHEERKARITGAIEEHADARMKADLRGRWQNAGFKYPLSREQMDEWEHTVEAVLGQELYAQAEQTDVTEPASEPTPESVAEALGGTLEDDKPTRAQVGSRAKGK